MRLLQAFTNGKWKGNFESGTSGRKIERSGDLVWLGKGAFILAWVLLSILPSSVGQTMSYVTAARMMMGPGHEMVGIPCQVNGAQRQYVCVIDSGATYTVVSDRVVKAEGPTIELTTGNGVVRVHQREVSLTIADGLELKSRALVQSRMVPGVDILVGEDVLRQFRYVTFDYENRKVEFER